MLFRKTNKICITYVYFRMFKVVQKIFLISFSGIRFDFYDSLIQNHENKYVLSSILYAFFRNKRTCNSIKGKIKNFFYIKYTYHFIILTLTKP